MKFLTMPSTARRAAAAAVFFAACALSPLAFAVTDEAALAELHTAYQRAVKPGEEADRYTRLFDAIFLRARRSYVADVSIPALATVATRTLEPLPAASGEPGEVFRKAIRESLRSLDPYSRFVDANLQDSTGDATSSFGGIGLELEASDGAVRVVAPVPGGPAARAGLEAGDTIVRVDELQLAGTPLSEAVARMRGQPGTPVVITYQRDAGEYTVSVVRDVVRRVALRWALDGNVLVLRLAAFTASASTLIERAIADATARQTPQAVILDLRGNPGGLLREAVNVADAFLDHGDIVSTRGNSPERQRTWKANPQQVLAGVPMVVLVDHRSASASELVADALQQNGRAIVMGQRSFGKGSVQTTYPLGDSGALKLTTAIYHGPSGRTLHGLGVIPDIEVLAPVGKAPPLAAATPSAVTVDASRCAPVKSRDPALACARAYLDAGSTPAFVQLVGSRPAP